MPASRTATQPTTRRQRRLGNADQPAAARGGTEAAPLKLRRALGINQQQGAGLFGVSIRTLSGWENRRGKRFPTSGPHRRRLVEVKRLHTALAEVMKEDRIGSWLLEANSAFEGRPPLELIESGEMDRLWRMIHEVGSGNPG